MNTQTALSRGSERVSGATNAVAFGAQASSRPSREALERFCSQAFKYHRFETEPPVEIAQPRSVRNRIGVPGSPRARKNHGHAVHFLERLERVDGDAAELALKLYRDPELLKGALDTIRIPTEVGRVALSLRDGDRGPLTW